MTFKSRRHKNFVQPEILQYYIRNTKLEIHQISNGLQKSCSDLKILYTDNNFFLA